MPCSRAREATESPSAITARNSTGLGFCNGWKLLVDLPTPLAATDNLDAIRAYLQPAHTAVDYVSNAGFSWQDDFDNDPASASYNPIPMVADGSTPISRVRCSRQISYWCRASPCRPLRARARI